jgi:alpha-tubulin suppressor-like RCC1 family protein
VSSRAAFAVSLAVAVPALVAIACGGDGATNAYDPAFDPPKKDASPQRDAPVPLDDDGGLPPGTCPGLCAKDIVAGGSFACALLENETVRCWGDSPRGQTGVNGAAQVLAPSVAVAGLSGVKAIGAGQAHACALTKAGKVFCWGNDAFGIVTGTSNTAPHPAPQEVTGFSSEVAQIVTMSDHACAITKASTLECWGNNGYGQVGVPGFDGGAPPKVVGKPTKALLAVQNAGGAEEVTCAVRQAGDIHCFGRNFSGQLGRGVSDLEPHPVPAATAALGGSPVYIARGAGYHIFAILGDGRAFGWGSNARHAVSPADVTQVLTPTIYPDVSTAGEVAAGGYFTCIRRADNTVACWGDNATGQMGTTPGTTDAKTPQIIPGLKNVTRVATSRDGFVCALDTGIVRCWGQNSAGQLGRGTKGSPDPVPAAIRFDP